ncbi:MAG: hypothetical protein M3322_04770 [Actinomycetota bacterium]|nr:hypothetical protein [Actinomycetota bacterium]
MKIRAERELLASPDDVWALLEEPYHLSDWWPGYAAIRPERRGFVEGARWSAVRSADPGLLRKPGGDALIVIKAIERRRGFAWCDVEQDFTARIELDAAGDRTRATIVLEAPWWRVPLEGLRGLPRRALARLHALCQTADALAGGEGTSRRHV